MNDGMLHLSIRKKWDCQVWWLFDIMRLLAEMIMLQILREGLMRLCWICPVWPLSSHVPALNTGFPGFRPYRNNNGKDKRIDQGFSDRAYNRIEPFCNGPG